MVCIMRKSRKYEIKWCISTRLYTKKLRTGDHLLMADSASTDENDKQLLEKQFDRDAVIQALREM